MRVLDLFCGAGGAAMGLHRAFPNTWIMGIDIKPQPRYPFHFVQADALKVDPYGFDFVWASPPCQKYSRSTALHARERHEDLIAKTRDRIGKYNYVIENVEDARNHLINPVRLCGLQFGLRVLRHRYFETSFPVAEPKHKSHKGLLEGVDYVGVHDGTMCGNSRKVLAAHGIERDPKMGTAAIYQDAMGIHWMKSRKEIAEAIPPAYSEYIARQFNRRRGAEASQCG